MDPFFVPLTRKQIEELTGSAYNALPEATESYQAIESFDNAVQAAQELAANTGAGFIVQAYRSADSTPLVADGIFTFRASEVEASYRLIYRTFAEAHQISLAGLPLWEERRCYLEPIEKRGKRFRTRLKDQLNRAGFYRFNGVTAAPSPWNRDCPWRHEKDNDGYSSIGRILHADSEDISEYGFQQLWELTQAYLARIANPPVLCYEGWTSGEGMVVCLDGIEYLAYSEQESSEKNPDWIYWASATDRYFRILDAALTARGLPERCWFDHCGNDTMLYLFTEEQYYLLREAGVLHPGPHPVLGQIAQNN